MALCISFDSATASNSFINHYIYIYYIHLCDACHAGSDGNELRLRSQVAHPFAPSPNPAPTTHTHIRQGGECDTRPSQPPSYHCR